MHLTPTRILRLFALVAVLTISMLSFAQEAPTALTSDSPTDGSLSAENAADVYTFQGTADSILTVNVSSDGFGYGMLLTDASGNSVIEAVADADGSIVADNILLAQTGSYFVTIFSTEDSGAYNITVSLEATDQALEVEPAASEAPATSFVLELPDTAEVLLNSGMEVRLQWSASVDLNLEVRDPNGNSLYFDNRTSPTGGSFGFDANGLCEIISDAPVERATWQPGFLPTGSYEILVFYRQNCEQSNLAVPFTLTVTVNGQELEVVDGSIAPSPSANSDSVYIANFVVENESSAFINQGGAYPDTALNNLPAPVAELQANAVPLDRDVPTQGAIFDEQDFVVFSFDAEEGEIITASMTATSRNLDTLLQLVDPNGNLISVNDDINGSTNSTISNQRIVQSGNYLLVATRYGKEVGGTEGEFSLLVTESTASLPASIANLVVPEGDIQVFLTWNNNTDLQLLVRDPVGQAVYDDVPQVTSGGLLAENGNVGCTVSEGDPLSYIYWPNGLARPGTYEVDVWFENQCNDTSIVEFQLTVVVNDEVVLVERNTPAIGNRFVTNFTISSDGTVTAGQAGFASTAVTLDQIADEQRLAISPNVPVSGALTSENPWDVYAFNATAGQVVTVAMQAAPGSILDTKVILLSPAGIQVIVNDDAPAGSFIGVEDRTTDSLISGFTIPADGEYLIVASRYATLFGGTTGAYTLELQVSG